MPVIIAQPASSHPGHGCRRGSIVAPIFTASTMQSSGTSRVSLALTLVELAAFLPMPWLLLGMYAVHEEILGGLLARCASVWFRLHLLRPHHALRAGCARADLRGALAALGPAYTAHVPSWWSAVFSSPWRRCVREPCPGLRSACSAWGCSSTWCGSGACAGYPANRGHGNSQRWPGRYGLLHSLWRPWRSVPARIGCSRRRTETIIGS